MDDTGSQRIPRPIAQFTHSSLDDIPEAVRDIPSLEFAPPPRRLGRKMRRVGGFVAIALTILATAVIVQTRPATQSTPAASTPSVSVPSSSVLSPSMSSPAGKGTASPTSDEAPILGHLPYDEAPQAELETVPDSTIKLRPAAAQKLLQMMDAARADGINLSLISGFRSIADQNYLFFDVKAQRGQNTAARADVSAPPGHSEHHTGYAVDLGDGDRPDTELDPSFDQTAAYQWLQQNAARYSFELSFAKNNPMGVSYEPWHWRFVGDRKSLETFYRARGSRG